MLDVSGNFVSGTDFVFEQVAHGTNGWQTGMSVSTDGTQLLAWGDVTSVMKKAVTDSLWTQLIAPGKVPPGIIGQANTAFDLPNALEGTLHAGFAGTSNSKIFAIQTNRVIVANDGVNFANTAINGMSVGSNSGAGRTFADKGMTDPVNNNVYYAAMGYHGFHYTLDGGATKVSPSWCPAPSYPNPGSSIEDYKIQRYSIIALDKSSSNTSTNVRKSRGAICPCGEGVYLTTDGFENGTKISVTGSAGDPGVIEAVSGMTWIGGKLFVCAVDKNDNYPVPGTENIHVYNPGTSSWSIVTTGYTGYGHIFIVEDPRYAGVGYWVFNTFGECIWTANGTTFKNFLGYFSEPVFGQGNPNRAGLTCQTKPKFRPLVAAKARLSGFGAAPSKPVIAGSYLYYPMGLGIWRTVAADFPVDGADSTVFAFDDAWPVWEEDCAGIEEIVGISAIWIKDPNHNNEPQLAGFGGDIGIAMGEDGRRGHRATISHYPPNYLSNGIGGTAGASPGWGTCRLTRRTGSNEAGTCYTKDAYNWTKMVNQPTQGPASHDESGICVAGPLDEAVSFQGSYGVRPQGTRDCGATAWTDLRFWRQDNSELDLGNSAFLNGVSMNGFWGYILYARPHYLAWHDNDHPGTYYAVNLGASYDNGVSDFTSDAIDFGGVYKMVPGDWPNFRRIYTGNPTKYSNYGYFDCKLEGDGAGHVLFMANYLPSATGDGSSNNKIAVIDTTTGTRTTINTVVNCVSFSFGAPLTSGGPKTLYLMGFSSSTNQFGIYISFDLGATVQGPFNYNTPAAGYLASINAHPTKFGVIAGAVQSRGHVIGRLQYGGS